MNLLNKLSNWYFSRSATPYWCILLADLAIIILSSLVVYAMFNGLPATVDVFWPLLGTLLVYCIFYMVGFRIFHTYSGVLRYSSFVDLQRLIFADFLGIALIMIARICFNFDAVFVPIRGRMLILIAVFAIAGMGMLRVTVRYFYDTYFGTNAAQRVFIYGVKAGGMSLAKSIRIQKPTKFVLRGFISSQSDVSGRLLMGTRVYPISNDLVDKMQIQGAKALLVSPLKSDEFRENTHFQEQLIKAGIRIYMMPPLTEWDGKEKLSHQQLKEVDIEDLLPREKIEIDMNAIGEQLCGQTILITGAAGSIGSEMVRQIAPYKPKCLVLVDEVETPMHDIRLYISRNWQEIEAPTIVTSICKKERMEEIFRKYRPHFVFHAAAYKHVPMMEDNPSEAVQNNIYGTQVIADLAVKYETTNSQFK